MLGRGVRYASLLFALTLLTTPMAANGQTIEVCQSKSNDVVKVISSPAQSP